MVSTGYPLASAYLPAGGVPGGTQSQGGEDGSQQGSLAEVMRQISQDDAPIQRRSMKISGDLDAVVGSIGKVTVRGDAQIAQNGQLRSGQTAYDTGTGFFLDYNTGTPRFSLGNSGGNKVTWDGTTLTITGSITATSGTIGGWTIGATTLTGGSITLDSTGNIRAGQTAYDTGTGFFLGVVSGTPKFSVGNSSGVKLTWDGTSLEARGKFKWGSSGQHYVDNTIMHFEVSGSAAALIEFKNASNTPQATVEGAADSSSAALNLISKYATGLTAERASVFTSATSATQFASLEAQASGPVRATFTVQVVSGTASGFLQLAGNNIVDFASTNRAVSFYGRIYPGTGSASQSTGYIDWDAGRSAIRVVGGNLAAATGTMYFGTGSADYIAVSATEFRMASSNHYDVVLGDNAGAKQFRIFDSSLVQQFGVDSNGFIGVALTGSVAGIGNWSTWAAAVGAGYLQVNVGGTTRRIPILADA